MKQVRDAGFLYDSSLMASDDAYEVALDGKPSGIVELPIERILDDAPYFGAANGSLPAPDLVDKIYRDEFDVAYEEGGLYVLTMHPFYTGHRSRAMWLEKLIAYMKTKPGVWFATHEDVANRDREGLCRITLVDHSRLFFQRITSLSASVSFFQIPDSLRDFTQAVAPIDDRRDLPSRHELAHDSRRPRCCLQSRTVNHWPASGLAKIATTRAMIARAKVPIIHQYLSRPGRDVSPLGFEIASQMTTNGSQRSRKSDHSVARLL